MTKIWQSVRYFPPDIDRPRQWLGNRSAGSDLRDGCPVLETIDVRTSLYAVPGIADGWDFTRRGVVRSWTLPEDRRPQGVSLVTISERAGAEHRRLRVEANLTAVRHGVGATFASLERGEVRAARDELLGRIGDVVQGVSLDPARWDVHRLDPSATKWVEVAAAGLVGQALDAWRLLCAGRGHVVDHGSTVTWMHSKARSWSMYDKGADARQKGQALPDLRGGSLLRVEARLRPRNLRGQREVDWTPTLELGDADMDRVDAELAALVGSLTGASAAGVLAQVEAFIRAGASPAEAFRLAGPAIAMAERGEKVLEQYFPERTAYRMRARIRELQREAGPDQSLSELLRTATDVYACDVLSYV